ncbi:MAG TPA: methyltransferase domain-containing protein [Vicinamibacterales bacterium]|nr:methyltransferase domain-containing protein [Vicinamibacterales bacterium]
MSSRTLPRILHLGCGLKRMEGAVNVDLREITRPDVVHDLDQRPWPFADGAFDEVIAYDVIEHLADIVATMEEIHRVSVDGAIVKLTVPHFSCANAFIDITHRHWFSWFSFHYFTGENEFPFYTAARFRRRVAKIVFTPTIVNRVAWQLANRWPALYEHRWAWIFPAWFLYFELEVVKDRAAGGLP